MTKEFTIYHNPKCSKSRKTLEILHEADAVVNVIEYLQTPPTGATLRELLAKLNISARELMRAKESVFAELGLDDLSLSEDDLIAAMADNPILIERPIVVCGNEAVVGRPPENVLTLIGE
ncbi:MAG: arsenate reductase (glutaredoxin) [Gammaproteobacteria bacterium]